MGTGKPSFFLLVFLGGRDFAAVFRNIYLVAFLLTLNRDKEHEPQVN